MNTLERLDSKLTLILHPDDELTELGIEYREITIKSIESMHDQVVKFRGSEEKDIAQTGNYTTRYNCSLCDYVLSSKGIAGEYDHHFRLICDGCYDRLCDLLEDK